MPSFARLMILLAGMLTGPVLAGPPDVPLSDFDGKVQNLASYLGQGQWVVVVAWAHDCHVCDKDIGEMSAFFRAHHKKDARVLGVSVDGMEKRKEALAFIERHGLPFPNLLAEPDAALMQRFGGGEFRGTPTYYLYDPAGNLAALSVGSVTAKEVEAYLARRAGEKVAR